MKKSTMCSIIGLIGIPSFFVFEILLSKLISSELNTAFALFFICCWGFMIMIPTKYFLKQEEKHARHF